MSALVIDVPGWVAARVEAAGASRDDREKMAFVLRLAAENVERQAGGPFSAAVFETGSGRIVAAGVNSVMRLHGSVLHAEMLAIMLAQHRLQSYSLRGRGLPAHELVTSCEPCAMCLGALHWSGISRLVIGAARDDAMAAGFDEGPVFPESYAYLADRGLTIVRDVNRAEAAALLAAYRDTGGFIYNPDATR